MRISGIYKIENNINHKVYIGQSVDCYARFRGHKWAANNKFSKEHNLSIHKAMAKYGINNFSFSIIETCEIERLNDREVYWIAYYNSFRKGYNETEGGNESHIHIGVPIETFDLKGNYVKTYPNITEAAKDIGVFRGTIYSIIHGYRLSTKGLQFRRVGDKKKITEYTNRQGGKNKVKQIDPMTNKCIKIWESSYAAARGLNIDSSAIIKCTKGRLKTTGGFRWERT